MPKQNEPLYIPRNHAQAKFAEAMDVYPALLLVAPNGSGKSTFLAHELHRAGCVPRDKAKTGGEQPSAAFRDMTTSGNDRPLAWVDINARTAVPSRFIELLTSAIGSVSPALAHTVTQLRPVNEADAFSEHDASQLVDAIAAHAPRLCIVLDGYEHITSTAIDALVDYLLAYLPDTSRIIVSAAEQPHLNIGALTLTGRLYRMSASEFMFTTDEAAQLLNGTLGFHLSAHDVNRICERMDGWPAGLRLVGIGLTDGLDVDTILSSSSGAQREISRYLVSEILNRLDRGTRDFLLRTSIFDTFCPAVCNAALNVGNSAEVIEKLKAKNLFVLPADAPNWYRYATFFRTCLTELASSVDAAEMHDIRMRAADWLSRNGYPSLALEQAINAGEYQQGVVYLNTFYAGEMGRSSVVKMREYMEVIKAHLGDTSPWISVSAIVASEMQRRFDQVRSLAHMLEAPESPDDALGWSLVTMAMLGDCHDGKLEQGIERATRALASHRPQDNGSLCAIYNVLGILYWCSNDLQQARICWQRSADAALYTQWAYSLCLDLFGIAHVQYLSGSYESAMATCRRACTPEGGTNAEALSAGYAHMLMAKILYDQNDLDGAEGQVSQAAALAAQGDEQVLLMESDMALARITLARGDRDAAVARANACLSDFWKKPAYQASFEEAHDLMAQMWLLADKPDIAESYLTSLSSIDLEHFDEKTAHDLVRDIVRHADFRAAWQEVPLLDRLFYQMLNKPGTHIAPWLDELQRCAEESGLEQVAAKTLVVKALSAQAEGDTTAALDHLQHACRIMEPNRAVRSLADAGAPMAKLLREAKRRHRATRFMDQALALILEDDLGAEATNAPLEGATFTKREREIIVLMQKGLTNDEIAEKLYVSKSTVKNHIHHVYEKLGVRNRASAILRIQQIDDQKAQQ